MKVLKFLPILLICITQALSLNLRGLPPTPKAADLFDHFGTEPVQNIYGPKSGAVLRLAKEGVLGEGTPIRPISNFGQEINSANVISGDLENTSYDASKIIRAEIAGKYNNFNIQFPNLILKQISFMKQLLILLSI
jgi:hypothetical protein